MVSKSKKGGAVDALAKAGVVGASEGAGLPAVVEEIDNPVMPMSECLEGYDFTRDLSLKPGQGVRDATFVGRGAVATIIDDRDGKPRDVPTLLLRIDNVTYRMLASSMLERRFKDIPEGSIVCIVHRGETRTRKGNRLTVYDVGVQR